MLKYNKYRQFGEHKLYVKPEDVKKALEWIYANTEKIYGAPIKIDKQTN